MDRRPRFSTRPAATPAALAIFFTLFALATLAPSPAAAQSAGGASEQAAQETRKEGISTGFDSIWTGSNIPTQEPKGVERIMLSDDKILVVLGVVLIIWFGIIALILRNDRRIGQLERDLQKDRSDF